MQGESQTVIKLYFETHDEANATAESLREEGFGTTVGRPLHGDWWSVSVSGEEERLQALGHRLQSEIEESA